ncbi:MAG: hypothetical protein ABH934_02135 [Chloroflexota bacterium]
MAKEKPVVSAQQQMQNSIENLERRLGMLDRRLDDIDSMVSAVIERVMSQPINISISCPNCGKSVEVALIGNKKPKG